MSHNEPNLNPETIPLVENARSLSSGSYSFPFASLGATLLQKAKARPEAEFLIFRDADGARAPLSRLNAERAARRVAGRLLVELNLLPGARIATLTGNSPETVLLYLGAWLAGITVVPINATEDDERIAYILEHSQVAVAFAPEDQLSRCGSVRAVSPAEILAEQPLTELPPVHRETEALIVYTSGTTGAPKGVVLTHGNLLADAQGIANWHGFTEADRAMCVLPLHHVNGTVVTLVTPLLTGGSVVLNRKFSASRFWKSITEENVTWCSVVPTILAFLCECDGPLAPNNGGNCPTLRHLICGAGPLTTDLARRFHERFGVRVVHGYGLSETTCYSCFLPIDLDEKAYARWMWGEGFPSIGIPLPENEMAIHDDAGSPLGPGERGEIVVRGVNVMKAYFKRPDANASAFAHGWFRSGDEGFYLHSDDGRPYFFITGRLKELFIRGGVNYSPFEIDEVLAEVPGVKAAMAVGFENSFYGEEIGAYVQRQPGATLTETDVLEFCAARLPWAKRPKVVLFGEEFPVTSTGKYQRNKLKERFSAYKNVEFRK